MKRFSPRRTTIRVVATAAASVLAVGVLAGCAPSGSTASASKTLTIAAAAAPGSLDPTKTSNGGTQSFYQELAYEPLLDKDKDGKLIAGLATKWGWADGFEGTKFTLTVRKGAKFADGEDVTAKAVADSLTFFAKNASGPTAASYAGWTVTASGSDQVLITTEKPSPILPDLLTPYNIGGNIISPKGLASPAKLTTATFGAGPYVYDAAQSVAGDHYAYVPNKNYYDKSKIKFDKVVMKVIANPTSALQALRSGQIDVFGGDSTLVKSAKDAKLTVVSGPSAFASLFLVDWRGSGVPALGQLKVRQALNYAIDRTAIAKAVFGDYGKGLDQPNTPGWDAYSSSLANAYPYDVDKAKALLSEAGYKDGFTMSVTYTSFEQSGTKAIQAVAEQLSKVGVTLTLKGAADFTELNADLASKKYAGFAMLWGGQSQFANVNQLWQKNSTSNFFGNSVDGLDTAFASYLSSTIATRESAAQAVEKVIVDQAITVPIAQVDSIWIASPKLKNFTLDKTGNPLNPNTWSE